MLIVLGSSKARGVLNYIQLFKCVWPEASIKLESFRGIADLSMIGKATSIVIKESLKR